MYVYRVSCNEVILNMSSLGHLRPQMVRSILENALGHPFKTSTLVVGEAFRPVVTPWIVKAAYAVSWTYLAGDVAYETYKAKRRGPSPLETVTYSEPTRLAMVAVQRSVFQSVASMCVKSLSFVGPRNTNKVDALTGHCLLLQFIALSGRTRPFAVHTCPDEIISSMAPRLFKNAKSPRVKGMLKLFQFV
jgi:hypothetical protein